jgi:hypothetical protein
MSRRRLLIQSALLYIALTVLLFAPNLPTMDSHIFNHPLGNGLKHTRNLWEGMESIAQLGYPTSQVTWTNFPDGGKLFTLEAGFQYLGMIFRPFFGVVTVHNLLYLLVIFLSAMAAMLLALEFTDDGPASVVAGAVFAFSSTAIAFPVISGVTETAFLFPLPLVTLWGLKSIYHTSWRNPVLAALLFLVQGLTCWSYGIGAAIILTLLFVLVALANIVPGLRTSRVLRSARLDRPLLGRMGIFVLVVLLAAIPLFIAAKSTVSGAAAIYERPVSVFPGFSTPPELNSAKVLLTVPSYFLPGAASMIEEGWLDLLFRSPYMGLIALALAALGIWKGVRGSRLLAGFAVLFMLLSFGPTIHLGSAQDSPGIRNVVYGIFWYVFPVFNVGRHGPDRYSILFQLFLAVVASAGLSVLLSRLKLAGQKRWLTGAFVALLVVLETLFVSPIPWPLPTADARPHEASLWLRDHGDPGGLLDLPAGHAHTLLFRGDIYLQQIYHQRPIAYNILSISQTVARNLFYNRVADGAFAPPIANGNQANCDHAAQLADAGFAYIVYRPRETPFRHEFVSRDLTTCFGPPEIIGDVWLFPLRNVRHGVELGPRQIFPDEPRMPQPMRIDDVD